MTYAVIGIVVAFGLFLCFALAIASFSFDNYYDKFKENNVRRNSYGANTLNYVNHINQKYFGGKLRVERCKEFDDHYSKNKICLSEKTMGSDSLASLSIVSHELGHAKQDFSGNKLEKHWSLRHVGRICGMFFTPLVIAGAILSLLGVFEILTQYFLYIGLALLGLSFIIFIFALILKYKEIQIEKEASVFALDYLREILTEPEIECCKEFLDSARLTYWASLFKTMFAWTFLTKGNKMFK